VSMSPAVACAPPSVAVVICAYSLDRWLDLRAAVLSVEGQSIRPERIVVVVDHNPSLATLARRAFSSSVTVLENTGARGLSGARNTGVAASTEDVVAFLDDDAAAAPDWLERLRSRFADPAVVAAGGGVDPEWEGGRPLWFPPEFDWVVGCTYVGLPAVAAQVRNVIGANMAFRRSAFTSAGTFTTGIGRVGSRPLGCEETELCIRARRAEPGAIVLYDPAARVQHRVPRERATWRYFVSRCWSEGLSKAQVTTSVGDGAALASERSYASSVLPRAFWKGVRDATRGDASGLQRSAAVATGLTSASLGYALGRGRALRARVASPAHLPEPELAGA
jgi:GT2 family glycosyltransferase